MVVRSVEVLPQVVTRLESFIHTTICDADGACRVVQVVERYWVYADDTWQRTTHLAADPLVGDCDGPHYDPLRCQILTKVADRLTVMASVASAVAATLLLLPLA